MNQQETAWLRKMTFLSMVVLAVVSSLAGVRPAVAQVASADFDAIDEYIGTQMKELAIMQLVEPGKIQLEAPVQTYLPWFRVAVLSTGIGISMLRQTVKRPEIVWHLY